MRQNSYPITNDLEVAPDTDLGQKEMKKLFVILSLVLAMTACSMKNKWEYKIVTIEAKSGTDFAPNTFSISSEDLNLFGMEGWELVDVYTTLETVHPNFGNSEYVTGIRENTRTESVNYVFKRKK